MGTLFVVATPIGNLEDLTLRALRTLKEVDLIACEDTRVTKKLLGHYQIKTPQTSFHQHSSSKKLFELIDLLEQGKGIALVVDAGTPGISDPGSKLIQEAALNEKIKVVTIPGPSALTAAASIAGLPVDRFEFLGFLPHKKGRQTIFKSLAEKKNTVIFYESGHRIKKALESLAESLPADWKVAVAKELTKQHEQVLRGSADSVLSKISSDPKLEKGEFVVIVSPK